MVQTDTVMTNLTESEHLMADVEHDRLPWEREDGAFTIKRLPGNFFSPAWSVYIAQDDPHAGISIDSVEMLDDLVSRLQQARDWLLQQDDTQNRST